MILVGGSPLYAYLTVRGTEPTDVAAIDSEVDEVELMGSARPVGEPLRAPITGQQAIAHSWKVRRYHSDPEGGGWLTVENGKDRQPFVLKDETGKFWSIPRVPP